MIVPGHSDSDGPSSGIGDGALRAEVDSLLEANARAGSFLESPAPAPNLVAAGLV